MEKIEFLASTGMSFYTPDHELRLPEELLNKIWNFRILQAASGAISLQLGDEQITNASSTDQGQFVDIGGLAIRFGDVINHCLGRWLPAPYIRKDAGNNSTRSFDWARVMFSRSSLQIDESIVSMVLAVDTTLRQPSADAPQPVAGLTAQETGFPLEIGPGSTAFWQSSEMQTWVKSMFKGVPADGSETAPPHAAALGAFMALMDGLKQAEIMPEITFLHPDGEQIEVSLVLDLGNSRACGLLIEETPGKKISLDECCKLEIRDLQTPSITYTEPFDTSFKFMPPLFQQSDQFTPRTSTGFSWPSIVRLGQEAAEIEPSNIGDTGMSSPKRYIWDNRTRHFPWYFNLPEESVGQKINAHFFKYLDDKGFYQGDNAQPPFDPYYPTSSLTTFLVQELLCHAYAQINSFSYRKSRGHRLAGRVLKHIVLTTPCGMSQPEIELYKQRAQAAIDIYFKVNQLPDDQKPQLHIEFDEATAVQLTYLYGEIKHRFLGNAQEAVETLGRNRSTNLGSNKSLRLASIDIGGGTSDLMIAEYCPEGSEEVRQKTLFSEGFSIAGDEVAKRIIEKLILKRVFNWAQERNPAISYDDFQIFFGPGRGGRDKHFNDMKIELCRQVWLPMAHKHLEFAELDTDDPDIELSFDRFFPYRLPGANVLDFFAESMRKEFDCHITLPEIPWQLSKPAINTVISNVIDKTLRIFSEVIAQFDCDALILGGKPSSLPVIRDILVRLMPVPSSRIIGLKGYQVGSWYPFSQKGGGISDPKTTCVVGAVVWLFAEKLKKLDGLSLTTDNQLIRQRECFIGTFLPEMMTLDQPLFPTEGNNTAKLSINRPTSIGIRKIDSQICMVNPVYELVPADAQQDLEVELRQREDHRDCLEIVKITNFKGARCSSNAVNLNLKTMVTDQYWIDTGSFDL